MIEGGEVRSALVCGGAGFIGSHVVDALLERGVRVTVIDPCHPRTSGSPRNLAGVASRIEWLQDPVERVPELDAIVASADVVIDAMGFTHHAEGIREPRLDHELNYAIHLPLLEAVNRHPRLFLYLGSRGQYGRIAGIVDEDAPQIPLDPQGVHKAAAESMIRIYSARHRWPALSLRLGNCFGPRQPLGADPGLVGGFIVSVLRGEQVVLYGAEDRRQHLLFVGDLARIVVRLLGVRKAGFTALNVPGPRVVLRDVVETLIRLAGRGSYSFRPFPAEVAAIHAGDATLSDARLENLVPCEYTSLEGALGRTLESLEPGSLRDDLAV
jgi:UDP-glucose 4-epimerase